MSTIKIPYLKWRNGRPRWEPGPALRKQGWKGCNLKNEKGEWLDIHEAAKAADEINKQVAAGKEGMPLGNSDCVHSNKKTRDKPPVSESRTTEALFDTFFRSPRFTKLKPKTRSDYRSKASHFLKIFGEAPVKAIEKSHLHRYWEEAMSRHGHTMANGILAVVRATLSHGERLGWITYNPARNLGLIKVPPRQALWFPDEITYFIKTADRVNLSSIGDAVFIALHSGQRRADVLAMPDRIFADDRIRLTQFKTGASIDVPMTPHLINRIEEIRERKRKLSITSLESLVIYEGTGQPYKGDLFNKKFALVRKEAAKVMPDISERKFLDLRDTAVTRLAMAGNTIPQICAITGHQEQTAHQVMRHYLVLNKDMADVAIDNLTIWMKKEGIEI